MKKLLLSLLSVLTVATMSAEWRLVTDASSLQAGDKIVITNLDNNKVLGNAPATNNIPAKDITVTDNVLTFGADEPMIIELEGTPGNWALKTTNSTATNGYIQANSSKNQLKVLTTLATGDIDIAASNFAASITFIGGTSKSDVLLKYNSGNKIFSFYATGQALVHIWRDETIGEAVAPEVSIENVEAYVGDVVNPTVTKPYDINLTYSCESNDVITIEDNVITAVGLGTATVTASWDATTKYLEGSTTFEVNIVTIPANGSVTFDFVGGNSYGLTPTTTTDGNFYEEDGKTFSYHDVIGTIKKISAESNQSARFWTNDNTFRVYTNGIIEFTAPEGSYVTSVSSNPACSFKLADNKASFNPSSTTNFKTITVNYAELLGSMAAPKAKYSAAKNELTLTAFDTNGNAVEGAEIRYAITADETAPEAYDIYDGAFSPDFEGVCYVWAYATAQGYVAGEPAIVRTITEGKSADFAPATELVDGNWYIIVAANGMHALGAENAEGHHDGVEVEVVDNKLVSDQHSGIIEFQFKNGHLAVKEGMTGESGDNYLAPTSANAAKAGMHKAIGAQPASTNVTFGDNAHEVTVDGQKLGYNAENGTFGFSEAHSEPVLLYTTADGTNTGVDEIAADSENAAIEYFNLQGVRVENPSNGLYIKRQGSKVSKVIIR